jgi:hypothetical protein
MNTVVHGPTGRLVSNDSEPVYAIQHPDGHYIRTVLGATRIFSSAAGAKAHIDTLPVNGYAVVRYS